MVALRIYARAPIRMATYTRLTAADLLDAAVLDDGLRVMTVARHKTAAKFGPAEVFIFEEECRYIQEVRTRSGLTIYDVDVCRK